MARLPCLWLGAGAPIRWEGVVGLSCRSTPFLWCLPKETVSSRQRKALFYPGGSTIRVSAAASVDGTHLRPTFAGGWCWSGDCTCAPFPWVEVSSPYCQFHPISLLLRKETGWSPKETRLRVPPASPTDSKPQHHRRLRQADLSAQITTIPLPKSGEDE